MPSETSNETMIEESLEVASEVLSEWEYDFLESIKKVVDAGRSLTENQERKLHQIYQKVCESSH